MDNKENVTRKTCHIFHLQYQGKLVKENLSRKTCQGKLASVYSRQVFLDKSTCKGKIARVNEALTTDDSVLIPTAVRADFNKAKTSLFHVNTTPRNEEELLRDVLLTIDLRGHSSANAIKSMYSSIKKYSPGLHSRDRVIFHFGRKRGLVYHFHFS